MRLFLWTLIVLIAAIAFAPASIAAAELPSFAWTEILSETAVAVDWSPNGAFIVFANPDARQIALLNWYTRAVVWRTPVPEGVQVGFFSFSLRWSPDGKSIATVISGNLYRIDVQTGELHPLQIKNVSATESSDYQNPRWSPDSASIAVLNTEGFIEVFSASTGELVQTIDIQGKYHVSGFTYTGFDWSPDGLIFAAPRPVNTVHGGANAQQPKQLGFWDRAGHLLTAYSQATPNDPAPESLCLSLYADGLLAGYDDVEWANDGRTLAVTGIWGYGICRLNIDGTTEDHPISDQGITSLRWSPDQRWLVSTLYTQPSIWITDTANDNQTVELRTDPPLRGGIWTLAWNPDSRHLAAGTYNGLWIGTLILRDDTT